MLTLLALAHPVARERRGGVIVNNGGHGGEIIDIIRSLDRPLFFILLHTVPVSKFKAS